MKQVTVQFVGGPVDGAVRQLPAGGEGGPPPELLLPADHAAGASTVKYLYRLDPDPDEDGHWIMRHVD